MKMAGQADDEHRTFLSIGAGPPAHRQLTSAATKAQIIKSPSKTNKHKSADKKIPLKNNNLGAAKIYCLTWARRIDLLTKLLWLNVIVGMEALTKMSRSTR